MSEPKLKPAVPQLPSGDLKKTADFYIQALGFQAVRLDEDHHFLILRRGLAEIHFWQTSNEEEARKIGEASSCYIRVENIPALYTELQQRKAPFRYELTKQPWGMNEMQVDDPYGNAIRFGEALT